MLVFAVFAYLLINVAIGFWAARRVQNASDFMVAGRSLGLSVAATSIFATWFGSETVMSSSVEFAQGGFFAVIKDPFGAALCLLLIGLFYVRPLYRLNISTFSDYFRLRFGAKAEFWSAALMSFSYLGWIAAQLQATGIILSTITAGTALEMSLAQGVFLGGGLVALYTCVGGMWAVSMTDFVQTIVILIGLCLVSYLLLDSAGGLSTVIAAQPEGFFSLSPQDYSWDGWMVYLVAWVTVGLGSIPQQDVFQRSMSARNERIAVNSAFVASGLYISLAMLPLFIGLCGKMVYPELLAGVSEEEAQMLLPKVVLSHTPVWVQILFFGALVSAIMSTTSGAILSPATLLVENLLRPNIGKNWTDKRMLLVLRLGVFVVTIVSIYMALSGKKIYDLAASSSSAILATLFAALTFGLYWRRSSSGGALLSMLVGGTVYMFQDYLIAEPLVPSLISATLASIFSLILGSYLWPRPTVYLAQAEAAEEEGV